MELHGGFLMQNNSHGERCLPIRKHREAREKRYSFGYAVSLLPAIKYFGHFQNPDTLAVDIYLLSAVDFAMEIGRCVNDDLLNELMQDTRYQLRDTALYVLDDLIAAEIPVLDGRQNAGIQQPPLQPSVHSASLFAVYRVF